MTPSAGYIHTATLTKLKPSTQYYYTYGDALFEFSQEYSFRTAPAVGSDATLHMLVNADMVRWHLIQDHGQSTMKLPAACKQCSLVVLHRSLQKKHCMPATNQPA